MPEFEGYCKECGKESRKKFVGREDEFYVYECSLCGNEEEMTKDQIEEEYEGEWDEWKEEWEE